MAKKETVKKAPLAKDATKKTAAPKVMKGGSTKKATKKDVSPVAAAKKSTVMTTTDIGDHLAATFDIPKSHAKIYLNETVALIGKHLKKGAKVRIAGLGVFQVKKRAARKGRNPNTGAPIKIKASKRVGFAAARDLKVKL